MAYDSLLQSLVPVLCRCSDQPVLMVLYYGFLWFYFYGFICTPCGGFHFLYSSPPFKIRDPHLSSGAYLNKLRVSMVPGDCK